MIQVYYKQMAKLIGPLYNRKAIPKVVRRLIDPHQYVAFIVKKS